MSQYWLQMFKTQSFLLFLVPATTFRHSNQRQYASKRINIARESMVKRFEKRHKSRCSFFEIRDNVSLRIPSKDRSSTDPLRLLCLVIDVNGEKIKQYQLLSRHGVLNCKYRAGDLEKYSGTFDINLEQAERQYVSLRTASGLESNINIMKSNPRCMCRSVCKTKSCACRKRKLQCSTHCHPKRQCKNTSSDTDCEQSNIETERKLTFIRSRIILL